MCIRDSKDEARVQDLESRKLAERVEVPEEKKEVKISLFEKESPRLYNRWDVYKRQYGNLVHVVGVAPSAPHLPNSIEGLPHDNCAIIFYSLDIWINNLLLMKCSSLPLTSNTVSYTHLEKCIVIF